MHKTSQPSLFFRGDTLLGVCQAIGEDFGFNPLYLRLALASVVILNPVAVIGGYAAAGALVALIRWIRPNLSVEPQAPAGVRRLSEVPPIPPSGSAADRLTPNAEALSLAA